MKSERLIQAIDIYKIYSTGGMDTAVIKGVSFTVNRGDKLILIGASGSGKTTLINIISGFLQPSAGQIYWQGYSTDISNVKQNKLTKYRRKFLSLITQENSIIPYLNVRDNILLDSDISEIDIDYEYYEQVINLLGIKHLEKRIAGTLSRGEAKRVNIAGVLLTKPTIIIGDEPVAALDVKNANEILDLFDKINEELGITFILTTHDQAVVSHGNKIIELKDGILFGDHKSDINLYDLNKSRKIPIDSTGRVLIPDHILEKLNYPTSFSISLNSEDTEIHLVPELVDSLIDKTRKCNNCTRLSEAKICPSCGYPTIEI